MPFGFSTQLGPVRELDVVAGWEDEWRRFHRPVRVGSLWIGPSWEVPDAEHDCDRHRSRPCLRNRRSRHDAALPGAAPRGRADRHGRRWMRLGSRRRRRGEARVRAGPSRSTTTRRRSRPPGRTQPPTASGRRPARRRVGRSTPSRRARRGEHRARVGRAERPSDSPAASSSPPAIWRRSGLRPPAGARSSGASRRAGRQTCSNADCPRQASPGSLRPPGLASAP